MTTTRGSCAPTLMRCSTPTSRSAPLTTLAPGVVWHGGTLGTVEGVENVVNLLRGFIGALPDLHATERDIVAEGRLVAVLLTVTATHKGELLGIAATGRPVKWDAVDLYRLADGKIAEEWAADDMLAILHQVGLTLRRGSPRTRADATFAPALPRKSLGRCFSQSHAT